MYAIVEIAGHQFKIEEGRKIYVDQLEAEEGDDVVFEEVLLTDNNGDIKVGTPHVEGVRITAKVLEHVKGDKIIVFKKKRRKGFKKKRGHRQYLSQIQIEKIIVG
ncbi:MAG: 50S ribosomal protein L21 [Marinilabiliaceae bacterium]|nr:50S ribosomal protein L21 [Marinilabiliaceae bacterium]